MPLRKPQTGISSRAFNISITFDKYANHYAGYKEKRREVFRELLFRKDIRSLRIKAIIIVKVVFAGLARAA